jgi:hypothetical protein
MAKLRPPRGGIKKAEPAKTTPKSFLPALPCMVLILMVIGLLSLLFYASLAGMKVK